MAINLLDITSNNNDLTNSGGAEYTADTPFAGSTIAVDLEATESDYLSITDANQTGLDITGDITIEGWFKVESQPGTDSWFGLVSKRATSNYSYNLYYYESSGYGFCFRYSDNGTDTTGHLLTQTLTTGQWYHIAITCDVSEHLTTFYINGTEAGTDNSGTRTSIYNGTAEFDIGFDSAGGTQYFDGQIDEVRIWNDIRTSTEISDNKSIELTGSEAGLVAYWPFETIESSSISPSESKSESSSGSPSVSASESKSSSKSESKSVSLSGSASGSKSISPSASLSPSSSDSKSASPSGSESASPSPEIKFITYESNYSAKTTTYEDKYRKFEKLP